MASFLVQAEEKTNGVALFFIGSVLGNEVAHDVDVLAYMEPTTPVSYAEELLASIRMWGLKENLSFFVDPLATSVHPSRTLQDYSRSLVQSLFFLESPRSIRKKIGVPVGRYMAVTTMPEGERRYYTKLPLIDGNPCLRPPRHVSELSLTN